MFKLNKLQIAFLIIIDLFCTYFVAGILVFILNGYDLIALGEHYSIDFTYKAFMNNYPLIDKALLYSFSFFTVIVILIPFLPKSRALHGDARFAKDWEIKSKMNLFAKDGIILGKRGNKLLKFDSQEFVALGAPTRSGKGVSIVIPNLLEWSQSCVVLDIKQECFDYTSKYRQEQLKQEVYLFNPFDFKTHCYNPLSAIDLENETTRDNDLLDFSNLLYPLIGNDTTIYFNQQAQNLFIGLCYLYKDLALTQAGNDFLEENNLKVEFTLAGILNLSSGFELEQEQEEDEEDEEENKIKGLDETVDYLDFLGLLSNSTKERLYDYINIKSVNTKSGVESSFNAPLMIYRNEPVKTATSKSDFDLRDLRKKKMTIYIGITPDKLEIAKPILNIFFSQLLSLNTKELPAKNKALKYSVLMLLDEFTSIGYMAILRKGVSYIAGYNLRLLTIFQDISQLEAPAPDGYGREGAKTLLSNHGIKIFFTPNEYEEAKKISDRLGDTTIKIKSKSYSAGKGLLETGSHGTNTSEAKRALLLPQELMELEQDRELVLMNYHKAILCSKSYYYNDSYFIDKFKLVSPSLRKCTFPKKSDFDLMIENNETNVFIPNQRGVK